MRAAHILATALVVANARPKWRADRAMLPALATLPRYPTNHTQIHCQRSVSLFRSRYRYTVSSYSMETSIEASPVRCRL